jgi:LAO/AO transport system kinase
MKPSHPLLNGIEEGNYIKLARGLTLVENGLETSEDLLKSLKVKDIPVIGITGPPGAGKSTIVNAMAGHLADQGKKIAILAVDPTSPFNFGSLLGDRIRMSGLYNHPGVYIRSVATRGALGGISTKTIEMVDVLKSSIFDLIIVETVGVGQSELEIAGLADVTAVVFVPESGDEIQHLKSGLMEIAQVFIVNKSDREGADQFANSLKKLILNQHQDIPVFKTIADKGKGVVELCEWLLKPAIFSNANRSYLMAEKAFRILQYKRMRNVDKVKFLEAITAAMRLPEFNLYVFTDNWI